jgi:hypothetical protein
MSDEAIQLAMAVKARYESQLMKKANVIGVGIGYRERAGKLTDEIALVVNVTRKLPRHQLTTDDAIPSEIEGVPVDIREIGEVQALGD